MALANGEGKGFWEGEFCLFLFCFRLEKKEEKTFFLCLICFGCLKRLRVVLLLVFRCLSTCLRKKFSVVVAMESMEVDRCEHKSQRGSFKGFFTPKSSV